MLGVGKAAGGAVLGTMLASLGPKVVCPPNFTTVGALCEPTPTKLVDCEFETDEVAAKLVCSLGTVTGTDCSDGSLGGFAGCEFTADGAVVAKDVATELVLSTGRGAEVERSTRMDEPLETSMTCDWTLGVGCTTGPCSVLKTLEGRDPCRELATG